VHQIFFVHETNLRVFWWHAISIQCYLNILHQKSWQHNRHSLMPRLSRLLSPLVSGDAEITRQRSESFIFNLFLLLSTYLYLHFSDKVLDKVIYSKSVLNIAMKTLHQFIGDTVANWQILMIICKLTSRFQKQVQSTIQTYQKTANQQNLKIVESDRNLLTLKNVIENHWLQLYEDSSTSARIFEHMLIFKTFLHRKLLEDYVETSYVINENIVCLGRIKFTLEDRQQAACELDIHQNQLDDIYQQRVVLVLDELMLDRAHVESKMRAASARDERSNSDIQSLINRDDWTSLTAAIKKNQLLTTKLLFKDDHTRRVIQRDINRVQKRYFRELVDSSTFVISKHASKLSVNARSSVISNSTSTASSLYADSWEKDESNWSIEEDNDQETISEIEARKSIKEFFSKTSVFPYFKTS